MVKSELILQVASKQQSLQIQDVETSINLILDYLCDALGRGERIEVRGFGSFSLHFRPSRNAHNPKTGNKLRTQDKYWPYFKPGKDLKNRINRNG